MATTMAAATRRILIALDFDGVLVDSAAETCLSGYAAAKQLFPNAPWLTKRLRRPDQLAALVGNFEAIRPCLETGWEATILLHLLAEGTTNEDIMANFQSGLRDETMAKLGVTKEAAMDGFKVARQAWIEEDGTSDDWLAAHGFYDGACQSVRELLASGRRDDVFVITTKAADFSKRLLAKQQLFGEGAVAGGIKEENIFGLGSGPKQEVLGRLLAEAGEGSAAVFVEDRLLTLDKTMADAALRTRVLPVLAGWGYNTPEQKASATEARYTVLADPASLVSTKPVPLGGLLWIEFGMFLAQAGVLGTEVREILH